MELVERLEFLKKQENPVTQALVKEVEQSIQILIKVLELFLFQLFFFLLEVASRTVNNHLTWSELLLSSALMIALEGVRALIEIRSGGERQLFEQGAISIVTSWFMSICRM